MINYDFTTDNNFAHLGTLSSFFAQLFNYKSLLAEVII